MAKVELEEIRRRILTPRGGEENQETNDILVIEERIQNENDPMEPTETEICIRVETEITDEERVIISEMIDDNKF